MNLTAVILLVLKVSIALNVLALGLEARLADATFLFRSPHRLGRALLSMNVLMPLFTLAMITKFSLSPAVKIALVALSVSPVPPIFPKKVLKAGGKGNYAIGLLVAAALLAIVTVPLALEIVEKLVGVPLRMPVRDVATLVFKTILAPLLIGMGLGSKFPSFAERAAKPTSTAASVLLILSILPVLFGSARAMLSLVGNGTILGVAAFALAGLIIGHLLGGPESENRHVLSLATATRHPGMAAAIAQASFPGQKLVVPAIVLYLIVAGLLSALASWGTRASRASEKENQRAA
jgi:bile acid:Na+ symporter, BASS family